MQLDVNAIINALREQMTADYARLNLELAVAKAENAGLRAALQQSEAHAARMTEGAGVPD